MTTLTRLIPTIEPHNTITTEATMNNLAKQLAPQPAPPHRTTAPAAAHLRFDPFTGRAICTSCWDRVHGSKKSRGVCQVPDCNCASKDGPAVRRKQRAARNGAKEQRKAMERQMLESESNPLRASNPGNQEPWLKLPTHKAEL
jgi:hypothetical protein